MDSFKEQAHKLVAKMTVEEKMEQLRYDAPAISRLNIPAYNWWNECLHGVARAGCATVFPQAIAMASSFDDKLLEEVAEAISDEARAKYNSFKKYCEPEIYQGLTFWSPNINIFRDPRWGRGHETYGEDPYLTGRMGTAFIKGLQGNGKYRKTDATIKHFAVHSGPEDERHSFNAVVDKKDLYETYLSAFLYCIENADPSAVMGAYNRVNGEACCASETLLEEILRGEFNFNGYIVSDCGAINDINENHHITNSPTESAALALNNGCNLNCGNAYRYLTNAYDEGLVSEETITEACEKLFEARFRLGMFSDDCEYDNITSDVIESEKNTCLNRKMARESIILLKNDGILPISGKKRIAVIGPNADSKSVLLGNYNGTPSVYSTILQGIQATAESKIIYARGCELTEDVEGKWCEQPENEAIAAAMESDIVILCMGLDPSIEGEDGDKTDIELPFVQKKLLNKIVETGKDIIFVNVSGSCVNLTDVKKSCGAIIQCFYPGAEGGNALADIIFGKTSPSGKLPVTFYGSEDEIPDFKDYSMKNRTYRYFENEPVYPFGYGLSYTEFNYSDIRIKGNILSVKVKNTGKYESDEIVQFYVNSAGYNNQPKFRLVNFKRIHLIPGEETEVEFFIDEEIFCLYDEYGSKHPFDGTYKLYIDSKCPDNNSPVTEFNFSKKS
ncbi:MAG: glycoside hydrolase family 3 C-terminal domain-containing protein [Clostridia bacterium]|nr:glycoside hydrolase family 3 C-terminal domain-containing protein [Clostridia bacterium]